MNHDMLFSTENYLKKSVSNLENSKKKVIHDSNLTRDSSMHYPHHRVLGGLPPPRRGRRRHRRRRELPLS